MKFIIPVLIILRLQCVGGAGSGILHFVNFTTLWGTDRDVCCSGGQQSKCPGQCDVHLKICIGEISPDRNCLYGQGAFYFRMDETTETLTLGDVQGSIPNPFVYRFDAWKVGVSVHVDVLVGEAMLIDTIAFNFLDKPEHNGQVHKVGPHLCSGNITGLVVAHSEACDPFYFGDCSILCMPDPTLYICDPDGNKQCLQDIDCRLGGPNDQTTLTSTDAIEVTDSQASLSSDIPNSSVDSAHGPPSASATVSTSYTGSLTEASTTTVDRTIHETSRSSFVNVHTVPAVKPLISSTQVDGASPQQYSDPTVRYLTDSAPQTTDGREMTTAWETKPEVDITDSHTTARKTKPEADTTDSHITAWETTPEAVITDSHTTARETTTVVETRTKEEVSNNLVDVSTETTLDTVTDMSRVDNSVSTTTSSAVDYSTLTVPHICTGHVGVSGETVGMLEATVSQHATDNSLDLASYSRSQSPEHSVNDFTSYTTTDLPEASSNRDTSNTLTTEVSVTTSAPNTYVPTDENQAQSLTSSASGHVSHQTTEDLRLGQTGCMSSVTASRILSTLVLQSSTERNSQTSLVHVVDMSTESTATGAASMSQLSSKGGGPYTTEATTFEQFVSSAKSSSSNYEFTPTIQSAVSKFEFTPTIQSAVSNSEFTPTIQSAVSNSELTPTIQSAVSNSEFTPTIQSAVSNSEFTPTIQSAVSNSEFTPTIQSAVSNSEFNPTIQPAVSNSEFTSTIQSAVSNSEFTPTIQSAVSNSGLTIPEEVSATEGNRPTKYGITSIIPSYPYTTESSPSSPTNSISTKQSAVSITTESSSADLEITTAETHIPSNSNITNTTSTINTTGGPLPTSTINSTGGPLPTREYINVSVQLDMSTDKQSHSLPTLSMDITTEATPHPITSTITSNLNHTLKKNDTAHTSTTLRVQVNTTRKAENLLSPTTYSSDTTEPSVTAHYSSINASSTSTNIPTNKVTKIFPVGTESFSQYSSHTTRDRATTTTPTKPETDFPIKPETHPSIWNTVSSGKTSTRIPTTKHSASSGPSTTPPRYSSCTVAVVYPGRGKPVLSVQFAGGEQAVSVVSIEKEVVELLVSAGYKMDQVKVKAIQTYHGGVTIVNITIDGADLALSATALAGVGDKLCKEASMILSQPSVPARTEDTDVDSAVIAGMVVLVAYLSTLFIIAVVLVRRKYRDRNRVSGRPMSEVSKMTRTTEQLLERPETGMTGLSSQYEESIC